ncbi:MAG: hypothetical protein ACOX6Y_05985 [Christensenellales bacterium]|jgi:hypothetical protein
MNKSRKLMSLLLVLVLALPMVFMTVDAFAADYYNVVRTSGGRLNVWPRPVKEAGSSSQSLKNGTKITVTNQKTYSTADKRWMVYITAPVSGWVDAKYVGKKAVVEPVEIKVVAKWDKAKLRGTAPDSDINIWNDNTIPFEKRWQDPLMKEVPLGYVFEDVVVYNNGTALVSFVTADLEVVTGFVRTKWLVDLTPKVPVVK